MRTTNEFLDAFKAKRGLKTDSDLARAWSVSPQMIHQYRTSEKSLSDERAIEIAKVLELDPVGYVLACVHAERAQRPAVKRAWEELVGKLMGVVSALVCALVLASPGTADASSLRTSHSEDSGSALSVCAERDRITHSRALARRFWRWLRALFAPAPMPA